MHKDIEIITEVSKPQGEKLVVYFSSISNNTHRFIEKLKINNIRIPIKLEEEITVNNDFVLITPTYGGGGNDTKGSVPKQVIKFLNNPINRSHCKAVIASGNTNFGDTFCLAGIIISKKLQIPMLYQFELLGTSHDVTQVNKILDEFWR